MGEIKPEWKVEDNKGNVTPYVPEEKKEEVKKPEQSTESKEAKKEKEKGMIASVLGKIKEAFKNMEDKKQAIADAYRKNDEANNLSAIRDELKNSGVTKKDLEDRGQVYR
ncbi:MAG: hypothetical protein NT068_03755 [Candidatus Nomurabacteria bacterium]|nr:hypothetical protein [Candidatus Nomurabacteria bacterium]